MTENKLFIPDLRIGPTSRTDFNETWLVEMPQRLIGKANNLYKNMKHNIDELQKTVPSDSITDLGNGYYTYIGGKILYVWLTDPNTNEYVIISELEIRPQGLAVVGTSKNPKYTGKPPYASDLYFTILNNTNYSILMSDTMLYDEGFDIWARLLDLGGIISIYDIDNPGGSFKTITDKKELESVFGYAEDYKRYRFVLSKPGTHLMETKSQFNTRRMRELSGMNIED
jgi:hypothetical protein